MSTSGGSNLELVGPGPGGGGGGGEVTSTNSGRAVPVVPSTSAVTAAALNSSSPYIRLSSLAAVPVSHHQALQQQQQQQQQSQQHSIYQKVVDPGVVLSNKSLQQKSIIASSNPDECIASSNTKPIIKDTSSSQSAYEFSDNEPYVVTVRNSPARNFVKSVSGTNIPGTGSPAGTIGVQPTGLKVFSGAGKAGPRLALYRSNSSLDLLDRDNYLNSQARAFHHSHVHQLSPHHQHQQQLQQQRFNLMNSTTAQQNLHNNQIHCGGVTSSTTGCFPRRKDGFGSHGSIDVLSAQNASFISTSGGVVGGGAGQYTQLRSGSVGTATSRPFLSLMNPSGGSGGVGGADGLIHTSNHHNSKGDQVDGLSCVSGSGEESTKSLPVNSKVVGSSVVSSTSRETASPRLRLKFLSSSKDKNSSNGSSDKGMGNSVPSGATAVGSSSSTTTTTTTSSSSTKSEASIFRKFRSVSSTSRQQASKSLPEASKYDTSIHQISGGGEAGDGLTTKVVLRHPGSNPMEERYRRRALAHHDCQSISANISYAARLRGLLSKRRNTTTGASAASLGQRSPPDTSTSTNGGSGSVSGSSSTINGGGGGGLSPTSHSGPPLSLVQPSSHNNNPSGSSTSGSSNNLLQVPGQQDTDLGDGKSNALVLRYVINTATNVLNFNFQSNQSHDDGNGDNDNTWEFFNIVYVPPLLHLL